MKSIQIVVHLDNGETVASDVTSVDNEQDVKQLTSVIERVGQLEKFSITRSNIQACFNTSKIAYIEIIRS